MAIINQVVSGGSSPTPTGKYQLLQRVTDDSNNGVGTVCGFFTDTNNIEYAVVCLDAQYRSTSGQYLSANTGISTLPECGTSAIYSRRESATYNCTKILDFATANNYTSSAVSHCRSQSFVIDGTTYYGQLPNLQEHIMMYEEQVGIENNDPTAASNPDVALIPSTAARVITSSYATAGGGGFTWQFWTSNGSISAMGITQSGHIHPILELPNA